ncbi:MAG: hypothetical protein PHH63_02835 [Bacteroidales bacterium]|jgi:hypothetical protein|nr:hypothetical protein [Bacteroidales bacterium]MDD3161402.1 hypothetical protein [Bacteroidales bacterium]
MKQFFSFVQVMCVVALLVGTTSCQEDEATISEKIIGTWDYQEDQTAYSAGLLLNLSGQGGVVDTATIITTVSTLFDNSEMTYKSDKTGIINKKVIQGATTDPNSLSSLLGGLVNSMINVNYTYAVSTGKVKLTAATKEYTFKILAISDTQMKVAMQVADVTSMTSTLFGTKVDGLTESPVYGKIETAAATFGMFSNPTVTMVFNKKAAN